MCNRGTFFLLFISSLFACQPQAQNRTGKSGQEDQTTVQELSVTELEQFLASENALLLDVRTPGEIADGKIRASAIEMDYQLPDFEQNLASLEKERSYVVYCAAGSRSESACKMMIDQGFERVFNLKGGYDKWVALQDDDN